MNAWQLLDSSSPERHHPRMLQSQAQEQTDANKADLSFSLFSWACEPLNTENQKGAPQPISVVASFRVKCEARAPTCCCPKNSQEGFVL